MVKPPVKVLAPERVSVPVLFSIMPPVLDMMPPKVVFPAPIIVSM